MSPGSAFPVERDQRAAPREPSLREALTGWVRRRSLADASLWLGWRLRLLVLAALVGCAGVVWTAALLGEAPHVRAQWQADRNERIALVATTDPALTSQRGEVLAGIEGGGHYVALSDALALQRSARWLVDDDARAAQPTLQIRLSEVLGSGRVVLTFADGARVRVAAVARGVGGLPLTFWIFAGAALVMFMAGTVIALANPCTSSPLYTLMAWCQSGNLLFIAIESSAELGMPASVARLNIPLREGFDLATGAAFVHLAAIRPRKLPAAGWISGAAWVAMAVLVVATSRQLLPHGWWWTQAAVTAYGVAGVAMLTWSHALQPHPFAIVRRRFAVAATATWVLLTVAVGVASVYARPTLHAVALGPAFWYVFMGSLLLLLPVLARTQQLVREFALLAAISTVATSLDLLFVGLFALGQFTSLALALFVALGAYAGARQWVISRLLGKELVTTERTFEHLYHTAREVDRHPEHAPALMAHLLRQLFEPIEVNFIDSTIDNSRVSSAGSVLIVPVPTLAGELTTRALELRYAHHGRHLFSHDDARLSDRIVEQLRRIVRMDRAVEQARSDERSRLAQDLHDDIGARLLTLMYKSPNAEMESYVRHTLQDLKTLTRGLAASTHHLDDAAGEWKADLELRLGAAQMSLRWRSHFDANPLLTIGQWSALTRILRELISNAIAHAHAKQVDVCLELQDDWLLLIVRDDGAGRAPHVWSHGLGVSGIHKRVRQLGGTVAWRENPGPGIACEVSIPKLSTSITPSI